MNTSHSDKKSTGFGIPSLYGNCPCKQRLDSGQDIIYKQFRPFFQQSFLPSFTNPSVTEAKPTFPPLLWFNDPWKPDGCVHSFKTTVGTCTHFWAHPESKAYRIPWARREVRVFHIIHVLLLWLCNCRCFLLDCLHLWGDGMRNATGDRKKTSMSRDEKTHTLKEKKNQSPNLVSEAFWESPSYTDI